MPRETLSCDYDAIVVGGGIAGLISGAFLAQAGKKVLLVEQEDRAGGFARDFQQGPYTINPSLHVIMGCSPSGQSGKGLIDAALRQLGVRNLCEFGIAEPFYRAQFPDLQMDIPSTRDAFLDVHQEQFPEEAKGLEELVNLCSQVYQEFIRFPILPRFQDWAMMPMRFPKLFRYANATLGSVMKRYLSSPQLMAVYATIWSYLGLPPSRVSFLMWAVMMARYLEEGPFFCLGGFQNLVNAITSSLTDHGGELIFGTRVTKIHAASSGVRGVSLANGQEINAPVVISNINAMTTFQNLLEPGQLPSGYLQKISRLERSVSVLGLYLATNLDVHALGVPKVTIITPWDVENIFEDALRGNVSGLAVHIPTVCDPSLAPAGEHLVILQAIIPPQGFDLSLKDQFAEKLLDGAERVLPDLRNHITFADGSATDNPLQFRLHRLGPMYGWAASPQQSGPRRLSPRTPIAGLFLTGHWTQPGHGIWTVVLSGINTARLILGEDGSQSLWPFAL